MAVRMEDLRYQSWSLGRQLNSMYEMIEKMCGGGVQVTAKRESRPISVNKDDVDHQQMLLDGLRRQDRLLREQIQDLIAKLPVRGPQNTEDIQVPENKSTIRKMSDRFSPIRRRLDELSLVD